MADDKPGKSASSSKAEQTDLHAQKGSEEATESINEDTSTSRNTLKESNLEKGENDSQENKKDTEKREISGKDKQNDEAEINRTDGQNKDENDNNAKENEADDKPETYTTEEENKADIDIRITEPTKDGEDKQSAVLMKDSEQAENKDSTERQNKLRAMMQKFRGTQTAVEKFKKKIRKKRESIKSLKLSDDEESQSGAITRASRIGTNINIEGSVISESEKTSSEEMKEIQNELAAVQTEFERLKKKYDTNEKLHRNKVNELSNRNMDLVAKAMLKQVQIRKKEKEVGDLNGMFKRHRDEQIGIQKRTGVTDEVNRMHKKLLEENKKLKEQRAMWQKTETTLHGKMVKLEDQLIKQTERVDELESWFEKMVKEAEVEVMFKKAPKVGHIFIGDNTFDITRALLNTIDMSNGYVIAVTGKDKEIKPVKEDGYRSKFVKGKLNVTDFKNNPKIRVKIDVDNIQILGKKEQEMVDRTSRSDPEVSNSNDRTPRIRRKKGKVFDSKRIAMELAGNTDYDSEDNLETPRSQAGRSSIVNSRIYKIRKI